MTFTPGTVNWIETPYVPVPRPELEIAALRRWYELAEDNPRRGLALGLALVRHKRWNEASEVLTSTAAQGGQPQALCGLALCQLNSGEFSRALQTCDQALSLEENWRLRDYRGAALEAMGLIAEACREYRTAALTSGNHDYDSLLRLMILMARAGNANALLDECEALAITRPSKTIQLAFGAVALDQLGRHEEARRLVDLERHVMRLPIKTPSGFTDCGSFNAILAEEIQANPQLEATREQDFNIHYESAYKGGGASKILRELARRSFEEYCSQLHERGLSDILPPPPKTARLFTANVITRGSGRNGQHIHPAGYLSAVYHVTTPAMARDDARGALELGRCDTLAGLSSPSWGVRQLPAIAGWLTVFPSYIFHDVVPTHSGDARISVALDMIPVD